MRRRWCETLTECGNLWLDVWAAFGLNLVGFGQAKLAGQTWQEVTVDRREQRAEEERERRAALAATLSPVRGKTAVIYLSMPVMSCGGSASGYVCRFSVRVRIITMASLLTWCVCLICI